MARADGEDDDGGQGRDEQPDVAPGRGVVEGDHEADHDERLVEEVDEGRAHRGQHQDLAGEGHLLHDAGVDHHRGRAAEQCRLVEVPDEHGREHVDDEVGDPVGEEVGEQDVEDGQGEGRVEHRPQEAEDRVLVLDLDLLADQEDEELPGPPHLDQPEPDADPGGDGPGGLAAPRRHPDGAGGELVVAFLADDGRGVPEPSGTASPSGDRVPVSACTSVTRAPIRR